MVEPIAGNMGFVAPDAGFLEALHERARRWGALLIFDEVITWLRFGLRGAQGRARVMPDLTALGKVMGGGVPIAAFGGREDVMAVLAPNGAAFTGGTHGGNPFCVAMAHRVLDLLEAHPEYYPAMRMVAERLARGMRALFAECGLEYAVVQQESVVDFKFRAGPAGRNFDDVRAADNPLRRLLSRNAGARRPASAFTERSDVRLDAHASADVDETTP